MKRTYRMGFRVLAAVALVACMNCGSKPSTTTAQSLKTDTTMQTTTPLVRISTNLGDIVVRLYDETPEHRDNFLKLAREGRIIQPQEPCCLAFLSMLQGPQVP